MADDLVRAEILARLPAERLLAVEVKRPEVDPDWFRVTKIAAARGTLVVRLIPRGPEAYNAHAGDLPGRGLVPEHVYHAVVDAFWNDHDVALRRLMTGVLAPLAQQVRLGVWYEGYSKVWQVGRTRPVAPPALPAAPSARHGTSATVGSGPAHQERAEPREPADARWPVGLSAAGAAAALVLVRRRRAARAHRVPALPAE